MKQYDFIQGEQAVKLLFNGFLISIMALLFLFLSMGCGQKEIDEQTIIFFEMPG
jgi:hypothetical protein